MLKHFFKCRKMVVQILDIAKAVQLSIYRAAIDDFVSILKELQVYYLTFIEV
jgi:hypothetical protein